MTNLVSFIQQFLKVSHFHVLLFLVIEATLVHQFLFSLTPYNNHSDTNLVKTCSLKSVICI